MAITMRHGPYNKFDPQKLRTAETAVVTEGDPHASDGKAFYQCFSPGDVKRMATYEDMVDQIDEAGGEAIDNHIEEKVGAALKACENIVPVKLIVTVSPFSTVPSFTSLPLSSIL